MALNIRETIKKHSPVAVSVVFAGIVAYFTIAVGASIGQPIIPANLSSVANFEGMVIITPIMLLIGLGILLTLVIMYEGRSYT